MQHLVGRHQKLSARAPQMSTTQPTVPPLPNNNFEIPLEISPTQPRKSISKEYLGHCKVVMVSKGVTSPPFIIVIPPFCPAPPFQISQSYSHLFINSPHLVEFSRFFLYFDLSEKIPRIYILIQLFVIVSG